ncbi:GL18346, partial [Drosophila persimilis]
AHSNKAKKEAKAANLQKPATNTKNPSNPPNNAQPNVHAPSQDQFHELLLNTVQKSLGSELLEAAAVWCARNPHIAICLLAASLVFLLPFLIIFGFGIATMVMTFTGLLVLEGTLLTIVSMMFFACLGGFAIIVPVIGVVTVGVYFGFAQVYGLYDGKERRKTAVRLVKDPPKPCDLVPASKTTSEEPAVNKITN